MKIDRDLLELDPQFADLWRALETGVSSGAGGATIRRYTLIENGSNTVMAEGVTMQMAREIAAPWLRMGSTFSYIETNTALPSGHVLQHDLKDDHVPAYDYTLVDVTFLGETIARVSPDAAVARLADLQADLIDAVYASEGLPWWIVVTFSNERALARLFGMATIKVTDPDYIGPGNRYGLNADPRKPKHRPIPNQGSGETLRVTSPSRWDMGFDSPYRNDFERTQAQMMPIKGVALVEVRSGSVVMVGMPKEIEKALVPGDACDGPRWCGHFTYTIKGEDGKARKMHYRTRQRAMVDYRIVPYAKVTIRTDSTVPGYQTIDGPVRRHPRFTACIDSTVLDSDGMDESPFAVMHRESGRILAVGTKQQLIDWFNAAKHYGMKVARITILANDADERLVA